MINIWLSDRILVKINITKGCLEHKSNGGGRSIVDLDIWSGNLYELIQTKIPRDECLSSHQIKSFAWMHKGIT